MLRIRKEQEEALKIAATNRFMNEMVLNAQNHFNETTAGINKEDAKDFVLKIIDKAKIYNLTKESDLGKFIEITLLYGHDFDTNPDLKWMTDILKDDNEPNPGQRINKLYVEGKKRKENEKINP